MHNLRISSVGAKASGTMIVIAPAACAALTPLNESSRTTQSHGCRFCHALAADQIGIFARPHGRRRFWRTAVRSRRKVMGIAALNPSYGLLLLVRS